MRFSGVLAVLLAGEFAAADWPQINGLNRDGMATGAPIAREWPPGGPRTLWRAGLGEGFGGPAIRDGAVYVLDRIDDSHDVLRCFDLDTGEERWRSAYAAPGRVGYNGSRTTPTVTESHVYAVGMTGQLYCFERAAGDLVWHVDLADAFPANNLRWGYAQSPSVYQDLLIVAPQSKRGFVVAFDRMTGDVVWKTPKLGDVGYSTPRIVRLCGVDQIAMITAGSDSVVGLSVDDGRVLWSYDDWRCRIPIPYATPLPDDRLFITGEYGAGSAMLQIQRDGGSFRAIELFRTDAAGSQIHQPLFHDGYLYLNSNGNSRNDGMLCLSLDGEVQWRTADNKRELSQFERGGLLLVNGLIVNFDGRRGTLHLIEPSPERYVELARAKVFEGAQMWAPLAIADGRLVLRNQSEMKCLDLRAPDVAGTAFLLPE